MNLGFANKPLFGRRTILVTGATGFIGGRIIERFSQETKARIKALVHNPSRAFRIARFDIDIILGDILNQKLLYKVTKDVDYVIHCAIGNTSNALLNYKITVKGTENLLKASLKNKIKRFVYFSTMSVYGYPLSERCNELTPYKKVAGDYYNNAKIEAEELVSQYMRKGLPVVILQPTIVYGPYGATWTIDIVNQLKREELFLIDNGEGLANLVYVDNVVDAVYLALTKEKALGEKFIISDGRGIPWRGFFNYYRRFVTNEPLSSLNFTNTNKIRILSLVINFARALKRIIFPFQIFKSPSHPFRRFMDKLFNQNRAVKDLLVNQNMQCFFKDRCIFETKKAKEILGYYPRISLSKGMKLTKQWLRYARII